MQNVQYRNELERKKKNYQELKKFLQEVAHLLIFHKTEKEVKDNIDIIYLVKETGYSVNELREVIKELNGMQAREIASILGPVSHNPFRGIVYKLTLESVLSTKHEYYKDGKLVTIPTEELRKMYYYLLKHEIEFNAHSFGAMLRRYRNDNLPLDFALENETKIYEKENVKIL